MGTSVCVIGAGVGSLVAVDLARMGLQVTLVDERPTILSGASAAHLCRLHLGPHYGGDPFASASFNTAQRCVAGTLAWLRRHPDIVVGGGRWWQFVTDDSACEPAAYLDFCRRLAEHHERVAAEDAHARRVLGRAEDRYRVLSPDTYRAHVAPDRIRLGVATPEEVIDQRALRRAVERDLADVGTVDVWLSTRVTGIKQTHSGLVVETADGTRQGADFVVNCSWHDLRGVDPDAVEMLPDMSTRLRFVARGPIPRSLRSQPSMFFLCGAFGSHTNVDGETMRVASEPVCNLVTTPGVGVPEGWRRMMLEPGDRSRWVGGLAAALASGRRPGAVVSVSPALRALTAELRHVLRGRGGAAAGRAAHDVVARHIVDGYAGLVPAVGDASVRVIPTVSIDVGRSDIDDPLGSVRARSWLTRLDDRGVLTVYPGKLTFGALAAQEAAGRIAAAIDRAQPDAFAVASSGG